MDMLSGIIDLSKVSLIVFTRNRAKYVCQLIAYYSKFNTQIIVLDGSDQYDSRQICGFILDLNVKLKSFNVENYQGSQTEILYLRHKDERRVPGLASRGLLICEDDSISFRPYVLFLSDDDFALPSAIAKGINILDRERDIIGVYNRRNITLGYVSKSSGRKFRWLNSKDVEKRIKKVKYGCDELWMALTRSEFARIALAIASQASIKYEKSDRIAADTFAYSIVVALALQGSFKKINQTLYFKSSHISKPDYTFTNIRSNHEETRNLLSMMYGSEFVEIFYKNSRMRRNDHEVSSICQIFEHYYTGHNRAKLWKKIQITSQKVKEKVSSHFSKKNEVHVKSRITNLERVTFRWMTIDSKWLNFKREGFRKKISFQEANFYICELYKKN